MMADADLKRAYERRVQIRTDFLELMRQGYKRYKKTPPFDQGANAEMAEVTGILKTRQETRKAAITPKNAA